LLRRRFTFDFLAILAIGGGFGGLALLLAILVITLVILAFGIFAFGIFVRRGIAVVLIAQ